MSFLDLYFLDFEKAIDKKDSGKQNQIPKHQNVIKNYANVELFHKKDKNHEDCLGWITIMEEADEDLRTVLKKKNIGIKERKKIAQGILNGLNYLEKVGIRHSDLKLENVLLLDGVPKIIDFGLICNETEKEGYRTMGFSRSGSKFKNQAALRKSILFIRGP